jgi:omega-6 fatty acid desaturase (delta-12 desaturase)
LQWFTGNIGFHHIHHLGSKIPNYNLPKAYRENPLFHVKPLTLLSSLKCLKWRLYDEVRKSYGKTIVSRLPDKSRSAYAVTGKTLQTDPQFVAAGVLAAKLLRS